MHHEEEIDAGLGHFDPLWWVLRGVCEDMELIKTPVTYLI